MFNRSARAMKIATALAVLSATAYAGNAHESVVSGEAKALSGAKPDDSAPLAIGTIQRLDIEYGQVTIAHGPLPGLGMGRMTMSFLIRDPVMFKSIKTGQRVRFAAALVDGLYTVTRIEAASP